MNHRGVSPIVASVLLIAIAVIASVGLYYWVSGIATKQPTSDKPHTIQAICKTNQGVMITDNSPSTVNPPVLYNIILTSTANMTKECLIPEMGPGRNFFCPDENMTATDGTTGVVITTNTRLISTAHYECAGQ